MILFIILSNIISWNNTSLLMSMISNIIKWFNLFFFFTKNQLVFKWYGQSLTWIFLALHTFALVGGSLVFFFHKVFFDVFLKYTRRVKDEYALIQDNNGITTKVYLVSPSSKIIWLWLTLLTSYQHYKGSFIKVCISSRRRCL